MDDNLNKIYHFLSNISMLSKRQKQLTARTAVRVFWGATNMAPKANRAILSGSTTTYNWLLVRSEQWLPLRARIWKS
jgi:hypothetical protein